jgi:hypothetical protein
MFSTHRLPDFVIALQSLAWGTQSSGPLAFLHRNLQPGAGVRMDAFAHLSDMVRRTVLEDYVQGGIAQG